MLKLLAFTACLSLLFSCGNDTLNEKNITAYSKQKQNLFSEEKTKPLVFLKVYASNKKNLWGSTVVKGTITNTATVCNYKDVRLKLVSYDKGGKMLEEHEDVINEPLKPNTSKDFRLRYHLPKTADSVSVSVMSASVSE